MLFKPAAVNTQFDFCHVQPATMFGCEMKLQLFEKATSFCWRKVFIQRSGFVGAEVIQNYSDEGRT